MDAVIGAAAAGAVVGAVLMAAVYLYKWLARSAKRVATSDAGIQQWGCVNFLRQHN